MGHKRPQAALSHMAGSVKRRMHALLPICSTSRQQRLENDSHVHQEAWARMLVAELFAWRNLGDALSVCDGRGLSPSECGWHPLEQC